jgi:hypothetical protein
MASYPPKKNTAYTFGVGLISRSTGQLQNSPTLSAGDVQISIDGGAFTNVTNLSTVTPVASSRIETVLTAAEMNGDRICIRFIDQAGSEWNDLQVELETSVRTIDDLLYPTYQLPNAVAADGVVPTLQQSLYMTLQFLSERVVAGTTISVKDPAGSVIMTFQLNDATNPTSITRLT